MRARVLTFAGDPKFYVEVEGASLLPHIERVFLGAEELRYIRRGYETDCEAEQVASEIAGSGGVHFGDWHE